MTVIEPSVVNYLNDFVDRLYGAAPRPANYLRGALRKPEMKILVRFFLERRPTRSLEWGLGSGISAAAFGEARRLLGLDGTHVVLDPFQQEVSEGWGLRCLKEFDIMNFVTFLPMTSEEYLMNARKCGDKFDFIFIDGAHDLAHKIIDAYMALEVLDDKGIICFHDSFFHSTSSAIAYLVDERGLEFMPLEGEPVVKRLLRAAKHAPRMGWKFSCTLAPLVHYSIAALRKRSQPGPASGQVEAKGDG
jgi:predicted O-methyltransferase YrrM